MNLVLRWWRFAQAVVESVTTPRTDIAQADRAFEAQLRTSDGFDALHRVALSVDRANATSRSIQALAAVRREWYGGARDGRVRAAGLTIATASAVALMLLALEPAGIGGFAWLLPLLSLAAGVAVMAAAGPIARALDRAGS